MTENNPTTQILSEAMAIRLLNSIAATDGINENDRILRPVILQNSAAVNELKSLESVGSANEFGNSCRICRWNRSDMEISKCPCHCKGSVGFIHLQCLKRWILQRRDPHCEICNEMFAIPADKINIKRLFKAFCCRCWGPIMKHLLQMMALLPLTHVVLHQVFILMENINQSTDENLKATEIVMASCTLLTSSALFFHFFEFIATRMMLIRNILRQWWLFGNEPDFDHIELESDILEFFD